MSHLPLPPPCLAQTSSKPGVTWFCQLQSSPLPEREQLSGLFELELYVRMLDLIRLVGWILILSGKCPDSHKHLGAYQKS